MEPLRLLLVTLAAYRVTRLVTYDDFPPMIAVRRHVVKRTGAGSAWTTLIGCPWCAGWWCSLAAVVAVFPHEAVVNVGVASFAVSALVGALATILDR